MLFLVNPRKKRRAKAATRRRRRSAGRKRTRRGRMPAALKAYWASKRGGSKVARKRRRRHGRARARTHRRVSSNPVRHRRRRRHSYRRNPGLGGRGIVRSAIEGVKCGAFVVLGEGVSGGVAALIPVLGNTGVIGAAKVGLVGTVIGTVGRRFLGANAAYFIAGAWAKAIRTVIQPYAASIPLIGAGLSGYTPLIARRTGMSGYAPRASSGAGMGVADDGSGYVF